LIDQVSMTLVRGLAGNTQRLCNLSPSPPLLNRPLNSTSFEPICGVPQRDHRG
jgi:hypothetical protein